MQNDWKTYPDLKMRMKHMLDIFENVGGSADKASDAEILVVDNMRIIGAMALQEWAI